MQKTWIILKSEFWRRVLTKKFVLITLLGPLGLLAFFGVTGAIGFFAAESTLDDEGETDADAPGPVAVVDSTGALLPALRRATKDKLPLEAAAAPLDSLRQAVRAERYRGLLVLPQELLRDTTQAARYYTVGEEAGALEAAFAQPAVQKAVAQNAPSGTGSPSGPPALPADSLLATTDAPPALASALQVTVRRERLAAQGLPPAEVRRAEAAVPLQVRAFAPPQAEASEEMGQAVYTALGWVMGFAIYFTVLLYGAQVMQSVMKEKRNRVVEVVVSSVRPFQLLMGKVLGVGAVGLLQISIWAAFAGVGLFLIGSAAAAVIDFGALGLPALSPLLGVWFLLFFLGGYLLYATFFAALGSTVEHQQDAQALNFAVILPLIIPLTVISFVVSAPGSTFSVVMSLIPFFSPILMPVRLAATEGALIGQALLALVLLGSAFVGAVWVSARIYRTGILMYGKKPGVAELWRWVRR